MGKQFDNVQGGMGRPEYGIPAGKARLYRVRLNQSGYDDGGAYWGAGGKLFCLQTEESRHFCRAPTRRVAFEIFEMKFKDLKLYSGIKKDK